MGFSSIQKTASTGSSATVALVGANSLQPSLAGFHHHLGLPAWPFPPRLPSGFSHPT